MVAVNLGQINPTTSLPYLAFDIKYFLNPIYINLFIFSYKLKILLKKSIIQKFPNLSLCSECYIWIRIFKNLLKVANIK